MSLPPLTLIVAATVHNGIGRAGGLPWPMLKAEMAYFARVTKRTPAPGQLNAVVMGRKTWESIPPRFRPLRDRLNVVVSRSPANAIPGVEDANRRPGAAAVLVAGGLEEALQALRVAVGPSTQLGRVFVIGGAELYRAALGLPQTERVLLTRVRTAFDCDTFFNVDLEAREARDGGWARRSTGELERWTGEEELGGLKNDADVEYEFCMFEREGVVRQNP